MILVAVVAERIRQAARDEYEDRREALREEIRVSFQGRRKYDGADWKDFEDR
jgi:hypothetical protein